MKRFKFKAATSMAFILCLLASGCATEEKKENGEGEKNALSFKTLSYEKKSDGNDNKAGGHTLDFSLKAEVEIPEGNGYRSLRGKIVSDVLGHQFADMNERRLLEAYADTIRSEISLPEAEDFPEPIHLRYEEQLDGKVTLAADSFLCYSRTLYIYQGGAHGLQTVQNFIYRLPEGEPLHEDDVFDPGSKSRLNALLIEEADKMRNDSILPREKNEFFNDGNIVPNGNFSIGDNGITYHYNPYDIAPYSYGAIDIALPAEKVMPLLNRQSPVFGFFFAKRK